MKRILALILVFLLIFASCATSHKDEEIKQPELSVSTENITPPENPEQTGSDDNVPDDNVPDDNVPDDNVPDDNVPDDNVPDDNVPDDNVPDDNVPDDNVPDDNVPDDNVPDDNTPGDTQPDETTHNYKASVVAPTCTKEGYTIYTCLNCGDSYVSDEVKATGHNYKSSVTNPTCTSEGYTTYTCDTCGDSYASDKVSALEHNTSKTVTAPTCENVGYTTYVCIRCDYSYVGDYVDALGHTWKDATKTAPKTCQTCGATEGEKLPSTNAGYSDTLYVHYIDVGQGDSIFIKVGDCDILIDAGTANYGTTVSNYLKSQSVDDIELMINTHPDADHCGGLTTVLNNYVVEEVWMSKNTSKTTTAYKNFTSAVTKEGLTAKKPNKGTVYTYEYLTLTVIYSENVSGDTNNSSIVVMLEYGNFKFLFTGDVGEEVEPTLISSGYDLDCDVLKVGHHGSKYSSTTAFLNAVKAEYGVICVGAGNSYGHPTSATLNRLSSAGVSVYRTDKNGNVVFSTNGAVLTLPNGTTDSTGSGNGLSSGGSSSGGSSSGGSSSGSSSSGSSSSTQYFIGNTETKVFHLPTCGNLPSASKQNTMYDYWWIINIAGYTPCGRCLKNYTSSTTTYIANATSKVYHISTCSYLPSSSNRVYITSTAGYTPCGHCIKQNNSMKNRVHKRAPCLNLYKRFKF